MWLLVLVSGQVLGQLSGQVTVVGGLSGQFLDDMGSCIC